MKHLPLVILLAFACACQSQTTNSPQESGLPDSHDLPVERIKEEVNESVSKGDLRFKAFCTGSNDSTYFPGLSQEDVDMYYHTGDELVCVYYEHSLGIGWGFEADTDQEKEERENAWNHAEIYNRLLLEYLNGKPEVDAPRKD